MRLNINDTYPTEVLILYATDCAERCLLSERGMDATPPMVCEQAIQARRQYVMDEDSSVTDEHLDELRGAVIKQMASAQTKPRQMWYSLVITHAAMMQDPVDAAKLASENLFHYMRVAHNERGADTLAWQARRLSYLDSVASMTRRLWLVYDSPGIHNDYVPIWDGAGAEVVIYETDETGEDIYAIGLRENPEYWIAGMPTYAEAEDLCLQQGYWICPTPWEAKA